jgi:AraC-like DNA-binding protein
MHLPIGYNEQLVTPKSRRQTAAHWSFIADQEGEAVILPDGCCDIILRFALDQQNRPTNLTPIITGPATSPYHVEYEPGDGWAGLRVYPANARTLWGVQLGNAQDHILQGEAAIAHLPSLSKLLQSLQPNSDIHTALLALPPLQNTHNDRHLVHNLIDLIHVSGGQISINQLAQNTDHSPRHILRTFRNMVGLSAKLYARIVQFHRALNLVQKTDLSNAEIAAECGYADQAHMIRAFQKFGGFSPSRIPANLSLPGLPVI